MAADVARTTCCGLCVITSTIKCKCIIRVHSSMGGDDTSPVGVLVWPKPA